MNVGPRPRPDELEHRVRRVAGVVACQVGADEVSLLIAPEADAAGVAAAVRRELADTGYRARVRPVTAARSRRRRFGLPLPVAVIAAAVLAAGTAAGTWALVAGGARPAPSATAPHGAPAALLPPAVVEGGGPPAAPGPGAAPPPVPPAGPALTEPVPPITPVAPPPVPPLRTAVVSLAPPGVGAPPAVGGPPAPPAPWPAPPAAARSRAPAGPPVHRVRHTARWSRLHRRPRFP